MTQTLILAHFWWGGKNGGGYGSLSLWIVEDKSYDPNPYGVFIGFLSGLKSLKPTWTWVT